MEPGIVMPPQYFGSVDYYAEMMRHKKVVIDTSLRYDKRFKSVHRCTIAGNRGALMLTVPVSHRSDGPVGEWRNVTVSSHGAWWQDHLVSLESSYGRTPFFEFYIDRFMPWLRDTNISIVDFDTSLDAVIRKALQLTIEVEYCKGADYPDAPRWRQPENPVIVPYYQVRADKLGFLPGMSILDLIFNMGPEAQLVLEEMARSAT